MGRTFELGMRRENDLLKYRSEALNLWPTPALAQDQPSPPLKRRHLGYLDGVRGLAALWVVLAHCMILGGWHLPYLPDPNSAVDIFMILSGYLMAYHAGPCGGDGHTFFPEGVAGFYVRRFFRVAPVFYLMLVFSFALSTPIESGLAALQWGGSEGSPNSPMQYHAEATPMNLALHFSFLFGLFPQYAAATYLPDWSIGLEMQFYAVFPLLILGIRKYRYLAPVLGLTALSFATIRLFELLPRPVPGASSFYPHPSFLLLKLPLFLIGIVAADAVASAKEGRKRWPALLAVLVLGLAACYSQWVLATAGLFLFLGFTDPEGKAIHSRWAALISRTLGCRIASFLAAASYGVYLVHGCCIALCAYFLAKASWFLGLAPGLRMIVLCVAVLISAYGLATAIHYLVERPGIELGRRLARRMSNGASDRVAPRG